MKRKILILSLLIFAVFFTSCGEKINKNKSENNEISESVLNDENSDKISSESGQNPEDITEKIDENDSEKNEISNENNSSENLDKKEENSLKISVNGYDLNAVLADTQAARELHKAAEIKPLTLTLSDYGGFEKVGRLPQNFTQNDEPISTQAGDIMLYQGDQITIFYGKNSWDYTPLGKIENITADELADIFGKGDVTVTISV